MSSISDLHTDILFNYIFQYLDAGDIWRLRLSCRTLHELCWDYFISSCRSLSVDFRASEECDNVSYVSYAAGVNILNVSTCRHLQEFRILGNYNGSDEKMFFELVSRIANRDAKLTRLSLKDVTLASGSSTFIEGLSRKCMILEELEVARVRVMTPDTIQCFLQCLLQYSRNTLRKLSLESLAFTFTDPLPTVSLAALQYFSVRKCRSLNSECSLAEVFRKCPHLEVIDLREVISVDNRTLLVMLEYCRSLRHVLVSGCPHVIFQSFRHPRCNRVTFDVWKEQENPFTSDGTTMKTIGQI